MAISDHQLMRTLGEMAKGKLMVAFAEAVKAAPDLFKGSTIEFRLELLPEARKIRVITPYFMIDDDVDTFPSPTLLHQIKARDFLKSQFDGPEGPAWGTAEEDYLP